LFCHRAERLRVHQLIKIPYATLPDLLLHLKNLQKPTLLLKIHHLHNLLSIIIIIILLHMVIVQSLFTLPLLRIELNKLLIIVLLHMVILQSLLLTLPLVKIHQLNKFLSIVLLHMFILQSLLTLPLLFKIHQLNKFLSIVLLHMFILQTLLLTLRLLFKIHQMLRRSKMPFWTNPAKILRLYWINFMMVLRIIKPRNHWRT
jgi:hypothetical protein